MNLIETISPDVLWESAGGDRKTAIELLELFFTCAEQEMSSLTNALAAGDVAVVEAHAHKMVGASAACGLVGLADDLRKLEQQCRHGTIPFNIDKCIQAVRQQLVEARHFFEAAWEVG